MAVEHASQDAQLLCERGQAQLRAGDFHEAIECFTRAIRLIPTVPITYQLRARAYLEMGKRIDALNDLDQAIRLNNQDARLYVDRAAILYRQKSYQAAIADCNRALDLDAELVQLYGLRGECYAALGDSTQAFADWAIAITRDPNNRAEYLYAQAELHLQLEDSEAALQDCSAALQTHPDHAGILHLRGLVYRSQGEWALAMDDINRVLTIAPDRLGTRLTRAGLLLQQQQYAQALSDLEICLEHSPDIGPAYEMRCICRNHLGDTVGAILDANRAIQLMPESARTYNLRAGLYFGQQKYRLAIRDHLEALKRDPKDAATFNHLAWLWCTTPHPDIRNARRALECATRACELAEWQDPSYLDTLAAAYAESGQFTLAVQWMDKAIALLPEELQAGYRERRQLFEQGRPFRLSEDQPTPLSNSDTHDDPTA